MMFELFLLMKINIYRVFSVVCSFVKDFHFRIKHMYVSMISLLILLKLFTLYTVDVNIIVLRIMYDIDR